MKVLTSFLPLLPVFLVAASSAFAKSPFEYVWGTAHHVLPETHSDESGYFSLCEGNDGRIYVGTAKYGENAYLVEFDPVTGKQRIVVDAHKVCGLNAEGFAAQAKFHTRNYVGPSGVIYAGTKQGYAKKGDTSEYPGGYLITYDPRNDTARNLGMPYKKQGIADVVADESRGLVYVVTCEDQHWMLYDFATKKFTELGPMLTRYATTLMDAEGKAHTLTKDFQLATYDPATKKVTQRPIEIGGKPFLRENRSAIPTWNLDPDGRTAWLILMNDAHLLSIDLFSKGKKANGVNHGLMLKGERPDSRSALTIAPDGQIYTLISVQNTTGFGKGKLHHLCRYDPKERRHEDLGVLAVKNPDFFNFKPTNGNKPPWSHGYHTLPDGTMTPLHNHMALIATRDNTLYATIIYPFTLLKIDAFRKKPPTPGPAEKYLRSIHQHLDRIEKNLPQFTQLGEMTAERYERGGLVGFHWLGATLEQELIGRSGGLMHIGFDRPWKDKKLRTNAEKAQDLAVVAWDADPKPNDLKRLQQFKATGQFVLGFGSKRNPRLTEHRKVCNAWVDLDTAPGDLDPGKLNHVVGAISGWVWMAETIAAHTRKERMPPMWKSWAVEDGRDWSDHFFRKVKYHKDFSVAPIPKGILAKAFLHRIRSQLLALENTQLPALRRFADSIAKETKAGRRTVVASSGHMVMHYVGKYSDSAWADNIEVHENVDSQLNSFKTKAPQGGLVLRLGYFGLSPKVDDLFQAKKSRVLLMTAENPRADFAAHLDYPNRVDLGLAFGDACVPIEGYPIPLFPPSGIVKAAAYESLNVEILHRLK
tara:strand:- start:834 stop:3275 length:2442 start_codon:yes stop_codon:yes gene_type:complete